jgi:hypothetical protein
MELKMSEHDIVQSLITDLLGHGVDIAAPMEDIQNALDNAGFIISIEEVIEFTDTIKQHRRDCPGCQGHYNDDGTQRDDVDHEALAAVKH